MHRRIRRTRHSTRLLIAALGIVAATQWIANAAGPESRPVPEIARDTENRGDALATFSEGSPDAPFVMTMLMSFDCAVCRRFLAKQYPKLKAEAVDAGFLRVEFVVQECKEWPREPKRLATAVEAVRAGYPAGDALRLTMSRADSTTSATVMALPPAIREEVRRRVETSEFRREPFMAAHVARARELREEYFENRWGTPCFVVVDRDAPKVDGKAQPVYVFYGLETAPRLLAAMGLGPPVAETPDAAKTK